jgi:hypothetical protein
MGGDHTIMKKLWVSIILAIIVLSFAYEVDAVNNKHGTLISNETWSNSVLIDGDLIVPQNTTLTIEPGTKIIIAQDKITNNRFKLVVYGQLIANGTDVNPIRFEPEAQSKLNSATINERWFRPSAWQGIIITGEGAKGILTNCMIQGAYIAISIESQAEIRKCKFIQSEQASIEGVSAIVEIRDSQLSDGQCGIKGNFKELTATGNNINNHQFGISCRPDRSNISNNTFSDNAEAILLDIVNSDIEIYHNNIYRHNASGIFLSLRNANVKISDNELSDIGKALVFRGEGAVLLQKNTLRKCQFGIYVYDTATIQIRGTINDNSDPSTNTLSRMIKATVYPYNYKLQSEQLPASNVPEAVSKPNVSDLEAQPIFQTDVVNKNEQYRTSNDYIRGRMEGSMYVKGEPAWTAAGLLLGPLGVLCAYLSPSSPPAETIINKSLEYTFGYTETYKSESKLKNAGYAFAGWLGWIVIYVAFMAD